MIPAQHRLPLHYGVCVTLLGVVLLSFLPTIFYGLLHFSLGFLIGRKVYSWVVKGPDFVIGESDNPYLLRWYLIPRNPLFNIYLHKFLRSDDDRALHDHPWVNCSIILKGCYFEHVPSIYPSEAYLDKSYKEKNFIGPLHPGLMSTSMKYLSTGNVVFRKPTAAHRIELLRDISSVNHLTMDFLLDPTFKTRCPEMPCWTLFLTGPRIREWGFWCSQGWRHWTEFTANISGQSTIGRGCE